MFEIDLLISIKIDLVLKNIQRLICHNPPPKKKKQNKTKNKQTNTHKLLWDFEKESDHLISARRTDIKKLGKKAICKIIDFALLADHSVKLKESEKKEKYLDLARELKKTVEQESDVYTNCNWCSWYSHRRINKGTDGLENKRTSGDHPNNCNIAIWEESWRPEETCCRSSKIPSALADVKNSQRVVITILDTTGWGMQPMENCTKNSSLTIRTGRICTIRSGKWDAQTLLGFWDTNRSPNLR